MKKTQADQRQSKVCEVCGERFAALPTQKYCSLPKRCAAIRARQQAAEINQRLKEKKDREQGVCPTCGQRLPKKKT